VAVELAGIEVRTPAGDQLIDSLDVELETGASLVITGRSGSGKTPATQPGRVVAVRLGTLCRPTARTRRCSCHSCRYVPLGTLRGVVCYPNSPDDIAEDTLRDVLSKVALAPLCDRLDEERDWAKVLSRRATTCAFAASCSPNRGRYSSTSPPPHSTKGWSSRSTRCCATNCPTASWLASAIATPSSSTRATARIAWQRPMATQPDRQGAAQV